MLKKINQSRWSAYVAETLTLTLAAGLLCGIVIGVARGWKYLPDGLRLSAIDALNLSINESVFIAFLFLFLFLPIFLLVRNLVGNTIWSCFIAVALSCLPFFLFWAYGINKANRTYWSDFFEIETLILNLKIGLGFILLWLIVSTGLLFWVRSRILKPEPVNLRVPAFLLAVVLIFNVSMYSFYNFHNAEQDSPNVIILLIDCLGAEHLSSYGYDRHTTPNIDEFSKDAVKFTQAISQSTFTKISVASLFTSLYPYQHGVYRGAGDRISGRGDITTDGLGDDVTTLAEVLLQNDFLTKAWIQQGQLASYLGFAQGFVDYGEKQGGIASINKEFIKWAGRVGKKRKFFAYLHYLDLHSPYRPKPPYDTLYMDGIAQDGQKPKANDVMRARYDGLITYIDGEIKLLLDNLKEEGLYDDSLIILTADHGDSFRKGSVGHAKAPHEEVIKVPLIIKFPKSAHAGKVVENQVRLIDVMPTILDFLEIKTEAALEGFSLMNYMVNKDENNDTAPSKYAVSEIYNQVAGIDAISIRTGKFKYIHFADQEDELYDLEIDPEETDNIIKQKPEIAEEFSEMLSPLLAEKNRRRTQKVKLDAKAVKELKALGYIQ